MQHLTFRVDGRKHFLQVTPLRDEAGIDWLVAVASPEAVFFAGIDTDYRIVMALIAGILIVAVLACIAIARRMARPILRLNEAARTLAGGDYQEGFGADARIAEYGELFHSLDDISRRLRRTEEERSAGADRCAQLETALWESRERLRMISAKDAPDGRSGNDDDNERDPQA
jgi:methyl-accepting chemotaxis protein